MNLHSNGGMRIDYKIYIELPFTKIFKTDSKYRSTHSWSISIIFQRSFLCEKLFINYHSTGQVVESTKKIIQKKKARL